MVLRCSGLRQACRLALNFAGIRCRLLDVRFRGKTRRVQIGQPGPANVPMGECLRGMRDHERGLFRWVEARASKRTLNLDKSLIR